MDTGDVNVSLNLPKSDDRLRPLWSSVRRVERKGLVVGTVAAVAFGIGAYYIGKPVFFPKGTVAPPPPGVAYEGFGAAPAGGAAAGTAAPAVAQTGSGSELDLAVGGSAPEPPAMASAHPAAASTRDRGAAMATTAPSAPASEAAPGAATRPAAAPRSATASGSAPAAGSGATAAASARNPGGRREAAAGRAPAATAGGDAVGSARVADSAICLAVENRMPAQRLSSVKASDGKIFCWVRVLNAEGRKVRHVWVLNGKKYPGIWLEIASASWRTWGSKRIDAGSAGNARVDIEDDAGKVLASLPFSIAAR